VDNFVDIYSWVAPKAHGSRLGTNCLKKMHPKNLIWINDLRAIKVFQNAAKEKTNLVRWINFFVHKCQAEVQLLVT
jgi:hypothetical protein